MRKDEPTSRPPLVKVTLLTAHTHAGVDYQAGDTIQVNQVEKAWLIEQHVIAADAAQ